MVNNYRMNIEQEFFPLIKGKLKMSKNSTDTVGSFSKVYSAHREINEN